MLGTILIVTSSMLVSWICYSNVKSTKKFELEYSEFLIENEGMEVFCYTNREKFQTIIERDVLPNLAESVHIIKLEGKEPNTNLNKEFISYALNRLENIGFPCVMKVVNGQFLDISLHHEIYNSINNRKRKGLSKLVNDNLIKLDLKSKQEDV